MKQSASPVVWALALIFPAVSGLSQATTYSVGPGQTLDNPGEVPWESLLPGDSDEIHWRAEPYRTKWVLCRQGAEGNPITIRGLRGPGGERPVISGDGATTRQALNFWNEPRGLLKIGGASTPTDTLPSYLVVEGLHFRSARPGYSFTDDSGSAGQDYVSNAAAVYVEKAAHLVIRDCELSDSGNGLFIGVNSGLTQDILIEGNFIHSNGIEGSYYEHNSYTAALGITFQYNHYGRLRADCGGNNLKDRSAGLVVRHNWIEGGNRQLDLVDGEDSASVTGDPRYGSTFVYGNLLIEPDGEGNSQIVHYGGDSGTLADYRKGTLYFFHNTVVSTRAGNTTLLRLSTNDEHADLRNNAIYTTASAGRLAMLSDHGILDLSHNWLSSGWVDSHDGAFDGTITDDASNLGSSAPGFVDEGGQDFTPAAGSPLLDGAGALATAALPDHAVLREYLKHLASRARADDGAPDLGALERCVSGCAVVDAGAQSDAGVATDAVAATDAAVADGAVASDAAASDAAVADGAVADGAMVTDAAVGLDLGSAVDASAGGDVSATGDAASTSGADAGDEVSAVASGCGCAGLASSAPGATTLVGLALLLVTGALRRRQLRRDPRSSARR